MFFEGILYSIVDEGVKISTPRSRYTCCPCNKIMWRNLFGLLVISVGAIYLVLVVICITFWHCFVNFTLLCNKEHDKDTTLENQDEDLTKWVNN